ncbi:AcrR family transcriptional regulator [Microbacterium sp. SORGH_AS428]|uniref:TetR/AcrR family transcriptional regulator n=1 Tax=Microbacterium sp. SORGH_AS_0428 TaxID=3041788 RepID=UPI00285A39CC|nr:TetR/AcrR family transcriptional regulator [Microbacterium sp. SORGH_AS_0428]MDR6200625.1 AcrR family transcriptional regulator [Microbacterium sp. SORGH_AS_0428]
MPEPSPRGYASGRRRRDQVVSAAFAAFGTVGYRQASMSQIAADCGVSRAGLFHHFPTKESLLEAVLDERDRRHSLRFFEGAPGPGRDGLDHFARLVALTGANATTPGIVSLYAVLSAEATDPAHPAHAHFVRRYENSRHHLTMAFEDLRSRGLLRDPSVDGLRLAEEIIAIMDGLQIQWLLSPTAVDMPGRLRERLAEIIRVELPDVPPRPAAEV